MRFFISRFELAERYDSHSQSIKSGKTFDVLDELDKTVLDELDKTDTVTEQSNRVNRVARSEFKVSL